MDWTENEKLQLHMDNKIIKNMFDYFIYTNVDTEMG